VGEEVRHLDGVRKGWAWQGDGGHGINGGLQGVSLVMATRQSLRLGLWVSEGGAHG
jgi:hypothetical protein